MLVEFKSESDLLAHYKAVRARVKQWKPPPRKVVIAEKTPEPEPIPVRVIVPVPIKPLPEMPPAVFTHQPTMRQIFDAVCKHYSVAPIDVLSQRRQANIVMPRQVAAYLVRMMTSRSMPEIGRFLGGRDHTTILHATRKIAALRASDPAIDLALREIEATLKPAD